MTTQQSQQWTPLWDIGIHELGLESKMLLDIPELLGPRGHPVGDHKEPALKTLKFLNASQRGRCQMVVEKLSERSLVTVKQNGANKFLLCTGSSKRRLGRLSTPSPQ